MAEMKKYSGQLVFGLDIGTRSIVGTVGYKIGTDFRVVAQRMREHETRAMVDGQIHDINKVGETIREVKLLLEEAVGVTLSEVCIAAAGRVLKTVTTTVEWPFIPEREVTGEDVFALASMGVEKAYEDFMSTNEEDDSFYCVGYTVIKYYLNGYPIGNLEGHKAKVISADLIATFLPDGVVDGLYKSVELAGLKVTNLTLEPIAAIQVAIPEKYRMLNMALVDVGAGTSDISITKDGSIVAYGMIPMAGDLLTEEIAKHCLVDFATAEQIKKDTGIKDQVVFEDIMCLPQVIESREVLDVVAMQVDLMSGEVAGKIKELNGDKAVSAVFVVGGGGKIPGYTDALAEKLGIARERVALRGEEVMQQITFEENIKKDSLLVTPIGICLNFYEQSNNFIFVTFNHKRIKIYDNNKLEVVDAAMHSKFPNNDLFPKRGKELTFTVNGKTRIARGQLGEASVITVNGKLADIHTPIHSNDVIMVKESTAGEPGAQIIGNLPESKESLTVIVNDKKIQLPKFAEVNGALQSTYYDIRQADNIVIKDFYTVRQVIEFMDVILDTRMNIYVNNKLADYDTPVYNNFSVIWTLETLQLSDVERMEAKRQADLKDQAVAEAGELAEETDTYEAAEQDSAEAAEKSRKVIPVSIRVMVNGEEILMSGKEEYVFVDVFDYIDFELSNYRGRGLVTNINGHPAQYMEPLKSGDVLEIYWKE